MCLFDKVVNKELIIGNKFDILNNEATDKQGKNKDIQREESQ